MQKQKLSLHLMSTRNSVQSTSASIEIVLLSSMRNNHAPWEFSFAGQVRSRVKEIRALPAPPGLLAVRKSLSKQQRTFVMISIAASIN